MTRARTFALLMAAAMTATVSASAQQAAKDLPKFPTPPPPVTAENSIIGPNYADAPETVPNPNVPQGDVREFILYSIDSKIYPGIVRVESEKTAKRDAYGNRLAWPAAEISAPGPYMRHVWVYIPPGYKPGTPAPFMVVQDGRSYIKRTGAGARQYDRGQASSRDGDRGGGFRRQRCPRFAARAWNMTPSRTAIISGWSRNCFRR